MIRSIYLTVRVDVDVKNEELTNSDIVSEIDYNFSSDDKDNYEVIDTEICGMNDEE